MALKKFLLSLAFVSFIGSPAFADNLDWQADTDSSIRIVGIKNGTPNNTAVYFAELASGNDPYFNLFSNVMLDGVAILDRLSAKAALSHTHSMTDVTGLSSALGGKQDANAKLTEYAGLANSNNSMLFRDNSGALTNKSLSSFVQDVLAASDANAMKATIFTGTTAQYVRGDGSTATLPSNVATATAFAANGSNCSSGQVAAGVDASGNAEGCVAIPSSSLTYNNNVSRSLNSNYTISTTRAARVSYSINAAWTVSALLSGSGTAFLEYSTDSGSNWITVNNVGKSLNLLTFAGADDMNLVGEIPADALVRIRTTATNMTISYTRGQEVLL